MKLPTEIVTVVIAATLLLGGPHAAWAGPPDCDEAVTTAEMRDCADRDYAYADAELNRLYGTLLSSLPAPQGEALRSAQRAWITFRDRQAAFAAGVAAGGTLYPLLEVSELAALTRQRTDELRRFLPPDDTQ